VAQHTGGDSRVLPLVHHNLNGIGIHGVVGLPDQAVAHGMPMLHGHGPAGTAVGPMPEPNHLRLDCDPGLYRPRVPPTRACEFIPGAEGGVSPS